MWTFRVRWRWIYQIGVCSWKHHDWDHYRVLRPVWTPAGHFCQRCRLERPAFVRGTEKTLEGSYTWTQAVDPDGNPTGERRILGTNIPGMKLG